MKQVTISNTYFSYIIKWEANQASKEINPLNNNHKEAKYPFYLAAVIINIHNRPNYLKKCLNSLYNSSLKETIIMLVDDNSEDLETLAAIEKFNHPEALVIKTRVTNKKKVGRQRIFMNTHYVGSWIKTNFNTQLLVILDSDTLVKKEWLKAMLKVYNNYKKKNELILVTGFNSFTHGVTKILKDALEKNSIGGCSMLFESKDLDKFQLDQPNLYYDGDWHIVDWVKKNKGKIYSTKGSVVQHIGYKGVNSSGILRVDIALDYWNWQKFIPIKVQKLIYKIDKHKIVQPIKKILHALKF